MLRGSIGLNASLLLPERTSNQSTSGNQSPAISNVESVTITYHDPDPAQPDRGETNRRLFADFVKPAFDAFEEVHADYINSLMRYRSLFADKTLPVTLEHPIFEEIELDSIKSKHLRTKVSEFRATDCDCPDKLREFLVTLDFYLRGILASMSHVELLRKVAVSGHPRIGLEELGEALGGDDGLAGETIERVVLWRADLRENMPAVYRFTGREYIFSDPMRFALRDLLRGFDAPHDMTVEGFCREFESSIVSDDRRRQLCVEAVLESIKKFQVSYAFVSQAYGALRAELLRDPRPPT